MLCWIIIHRRLQSSWGNKIYLKRKSFRIICSNINYEQLHVINFSHSSIFWVIESILGIKMAWWLRTLAALSEDLGPVLSTHLMDHNCNSSARTSAALFWPCPVSGTHTRCTYIHAEKNTHTHNKVNKSLKKVISTLSSFPFFPFFIELTLKNDHKCLQIFCFFCIIFSFHLNQVKYSSVFFP